METSEQTPDRPRAVVAPIVVFLMVPIALVGAFMHWVVWSFDAGENEARVDWLPPTASRVCWYRGYKATAFEFDMREEDFLAWARTPETRTRLGVDVLVPIDSSRRNPSVVYRYLYYLAVVEGRAQAGLPPELPPEMAEVGSFGLDARALAERRQSLPARRRWTAGVRTWVQAKRGWESKTADGTDSGHRLIYDADSGRAYYNWRGG